MNKDFQVNYRLGGEVWQPRFVARLDAKKCVSCGLCLNTCPSGVFIKTVKGTIEPRRRSQCIGCSVCEKICPENAIQCASRAELSDLGLLTTG